MPAYEMSIGCSGSEYRLLECAEERSNLDLNHNDDWGVTCNNGA